MLFPFTRSVAVAELLFQRCLTIGCVRNLRFEIRLTLNGCGVLSGCSIGREPTRRFEIGEPTFERRTLFCRFCELGAELPLATRQMLSGGARLCGMFVSSAIERHDALENALLERVLLHRGLSNRVIVLRLFLGQACCRRRQLRREPRDRIVMGRFRLRQLLLERGTCRGCVLQLRLEIRLTVGRSRAFGGAFFIRALSRGACLSETALQFDVRGTRPFDQLAEFVLAT